MKYVHAANQPAAHAAFRIDKGAVFTTEEKVTYPGTNNYTQWTYDGFGRRVKEVETRGGSITSTKQFVWASGTTPLEARDASSNITAQYFPYGETISGSNFSYTIDQLGSTREVTNSSGTVVGQLNYDAWGRAIVIQGTTSPDFQYAGYYFHAPSGLNLALNRAYSASLGRWMNRDPIEESGGVNLFAYVLNDPILWIDPFGLKQKCPTKPKQSTRSKGPPIPPIPPPIPNRGPRTIWTTGSAWSRTTGE